ncbi:hypothetical protein H9X78_02655 [Clostridium saudiense]|nr:hypothetical protein [Clostridium saudiense]
MEILELLEYVNKNLSSGLSTSAVEKKMKVGKDTIRKKLNRAGYIYNKNLNCYEKRNNITEINNNSYITESNIKENKSKKDNHKIIKNNYEENLTREEISFVKMLYKQHLEKQSLNDIEISEIITRSIRIDKKIMNLFANYCKNNNLNQARAISKALLDFIKNN